jgi:hypothetical protein
LPGATVIIGEAKIGDMIWIWEFFRVILSENLKCRWG